MQLFFGELYILVADCRFSYNLFLHYGVLLLRPCGREVWGANNPNIASARPMGACIGLRLLRTERALAASRPQLQFHCCHQQFPHIIINCNYSEGEPIGTGSLFFLRLAASLCYAARRKGSGVSLTRGFRSRQRRSLHPRLCSCRR